jgi:hypothetical protein
MATDGTAYEYFGNSVAICNDTNVVGAPHIYGTVDSGRAYVYV